MRMPQEQIVCLPDISKQVSEDNQVTIDFLLPNGVFLPLNVEFHQPLDLLKQRIWKSAEDFPLYNLLKCHDGYTFEYLNRNGEREDVLDESLRLSEVRPIGKFLRLKERQDGSRTQTLDKQILVLLGNKNAMELHSRPRTEVDDFRKKMDKFLAAKVPVKKNFQALFEVKFPLQLRSCEMFPEHLLNKVDNGYLAMTIRVKDTVSPKLIVSCHIQDSAEMAVDTAMRKWRNQSVRDTSDWVLKVVGREEYLYGKTPLFRFKYVYNCLQRSIAPDLWLVNQKKTLQTESSNNRQKPLPRLPPEVPISQYAHKDVTVWDINSNFEIKISNIVNIEITSDQVKDNIDKVKLCVGLYHGIEVLGDVKTTTELPVEKGNCRVDMTLDFDIPVKDVQAASRLCFTLNGRMKGAKSSNTIAWVNIPVFDFRSRLLIGQHKLAMWPVTAELQLEETGCYPIGSVSMNPHNTIVLNVTFSDYNCSPPIVFPSDEMITQCAADNMEANGMPGAPDWRPPKEKIYELDKIIMEEVFHEQDKETVWLMRYELRDENPYQLANVLKSVKWHNHVDVAKMQLLLFTWNEKLPVDYALELLDFNFPDKNVRKYAVDCLQDLGDDELFLYLLQLVQALKYENYLYCPLAEFLLERALSNQHIGHQLFWLLKSELHDPIVTIRFGLLLEAYLKASPDHMGVLYSQFECLNKLNAVSQLVKNEKNIKDEKSKEKALNNMKSVLEQKTYEVKLSNLCSPLSPLYNLRELKLKKCKFMDSKKRPLYLVWSNEDEEGSEIHIIYKNGDDLRQDMLTLQMLQVMDSLWQKDGLDLRMNVYNCVATGHEQGMIEVVRHSITLASIQKTRKATAFDKRTLFDWLKSVPVNKTEKELDQAIEEFTLSCAGYTVATYILGIGDRHNDNIMMKETGQIFHIDFGHFLGNFKSKFKIRRERVPFVLTSHFVYIITKGETQPENYKKFEDYCVKAYLTLRRNGPLLIRLFMMMLNSGIPQLSSVNDLDYIKDTLAVRLTDEEAIKQLKKQMKDALSAVSTSINWYIHNLAH